MKTLTTEIHTILDWLRWTSSRFNASQIVYGHGTDNFWDEALHLVLTSLYLPINTPTELYNARLTETERLLIIKLVDHRIRNRIPVPYLTNKAWFCGLEFYVDKRVFIPRSPIGELILSCFHNTLPSPPQYILDMCTGSGCIAIAIALVYPTSEIDAVDISMDSLKVAEYNIKLHNLEHRILPIHSNLFSDVPSFKYDLIIANPPYISNMDMLTLPKEFLHEPILSLSANHDGLGIILQILIKASNYLNVNGILICEVGKSKNLLIKYYPDIPFYWFNVTHGGDGIFLLTYDQLLFLNKQYQLHD